MAKYNEGVLTGESWTRAFQIVISNKYEEIPVIRFDEEDVIIASDNKKIVNRKDTSIIYAFNPNESETEFELFNPATDQPLGVTSKYQDLYVLLYSIYYHMAELRDRGPKPYPSWTWDNTTELWVAPIVQSYPSWTWNEDNQVWVAPIAKPDEINTYNWNETTLSWDLV